MPAGGGERVFNVTRRLLQLGVPFVFVTGLPEQVQLAAVTHLAVSVFRKPVTAEALLTEVRRLLKRPGRSQA